MKLKKFLTSILAFSLLSTPTLALAEATPGDGAMDELWGVPILAHGANLSNDQLNQVRNILGITDTEFDSVTVTGADMVHFLGSGNPNASMYSSALITRRASGEGVEVSILTPNNITRVTEVQYANAMITAGVADALVEIAAPFPVTGEAALTGIYKAFDERGYELDSDRMEVAQQELEITSSIAQELANNPDFDSENLDAVLLEIKNNLAEAYDSAGSIAGDEEVQRIVREALENNELDDIISPEQMQRIAGFASRFQLTDAIRSPEFRDQLTNLADRIGMDVGSLLNSVSRDQAMGFFARIANWFRNLFN